MTQSEILTVKNLKKTFSRPDGQPLEILKGVDLKINMGERVIIVGKSGTGKSTLLHILGTLDSPSSGKVLYMGQNIFSWDEKKLCHFRNHELGFIFQFHYLMPEFTAIENVVMPALIANEDKKYAYKKAEQLLIKVGLEERISHKPNKLSGGERQRVAIARALILKPKLLLTDEMTGNLDPVTASQVFELLNKIYDEFGMAIVSVTHDEQFAEMHPSTTYRLANGVLSKIN